MKGGGKRERERASSGKSSNGPSGAAGKAKSPAEGLEHPTVEMARQLASIVESHSLSELVVDTPELTLTLRRGERTAGAGVQAVAATAAPAALFPAPAASPRASDAHAAAPAAAPAEPPATPEPQYHVVTSPFVGTFYSSPGPDSDPYVTEGQKIDKGQVLCIVEAMKLMNEIEADMAGVVAAILVENAQPVEYGQPLFRVAPA